MTNDQAPQHALVAKPDICHHSQAEFLEIFKWYAQRNAPHLQRHGHYVLFYTIPDDLGLTAAQANKLCHRVARHYDIPWHEIDVAWLHEDLRTVEEVQQRLWHTANQLNQNN